jgi:DNA-binding LacI/PurR family transcriptional regulator
MNDILLPSLSDTGGRAKYREITEHLRNLISHGDLEPGTRLPSIKIMAKQWHTNYFTVQSALTPLANEGLIERTPRRGTFVRTRSSKLSAVACYFGSNFWNNAEGAFYQKAYAAIQSLAHRRSIRCELFIDNRPVREQFHELPELVKAAQNREIQGVIGMMLNSEDSVWLKRLNVPLALMQDVGVHQREEEIFALVLDRLAADGCRTVGILRRGNVASCELFQQMARARGMKTDPTWCPLVPDNWNQGGERFAYQAFKEMWARQERPEGLYVEADWDCRGAVTAMLELGVRVPQNLKLVLYRNSSVTYVCPWHVPAIVLDTDEVAAVFIDYIEAQHRAQRLDLPPFPLKVRLVN